MEASKNQAISIFRCSTFDYSTVLRLTWRSERAQRVTKSVEILDKNGGNGYGKLLMCVVMQCCIIIGDGNQGMARYSCLLAQNYGYDLQILFYH